MNRLAGGSKLKAQDRSFDWTPLLVHDMGYEVQGAYSSESFLVSLSVLTIFFAGSIGVMHFSRRTSHQVQQHLRVDGEIQQPFDVFVSGSEDQRTPNSEVKLTETTEVMTCP